MVSVFLDIRECFERSHEHQRFDNINLLSDPYLTHQSEMRFSTTPLLVLGLLTTRELHFRISDPRNTD